jgi:hypothetical protein
MTTTFRRSMLLLAACALAACSGGSPSAPGDGGGNTGGGNTGGGSPGVPALGPNASLNGKRPFPADNPWNRDVSGDPVDPNSATLIAACRSASTGLHPDFGTVWNGAPNGIP